MNIPVSVLSAVDKPSILAHFLALSPESRYLRFGTAMSAQNLASYVERLNEQSDVLLGVANDTELLAFMHIATVPGVDGVREIGVSVLEKCRRQGLAALLLRYAKDLAFYCKWNRVEMLHVSENVAVSRLCKKEGLFLLRDGMEYVGVWETAHGYQQSMDQEAPYLANFIDSLV